MNCRTHAKSQEWPVVPVTAALYGARTGTLLGLADCHHSYRFIERPCHTWIVWRVIEQDIQHMLLYLCMCAYMYDVHTSYKHATYILWLGLSHKGSKVWFCSPSLYPTSLCSGLKEPSLTRVPRMSSDLAFGPMSNSCSLKVLSNLFADVIGYSFHVLRAAKLAV